MKQETRLTDRLKGNPPISIPVDLSLVERQLKAKPFRPHPLLRNNHAQTILAYLYPRRAQLNSELKNDEERLFEVAPGVRLLAHCRWQTREKRRKTPTLILVHGLEGSSNSIYMLGTAAAAFANGFNVLRLNLRSCGSTEHLTNTLYHSGMSEDLRRIIEELIEKDCLEQIFLAGFSLGGNMSLKLAGEWNENPPPELRGVAAVSPPIDLAACSDAIGFRSNWIYNRRFLNNLAKRMRRVQKLYPERFQTEGIEQIRSIRDFDSRFTAPYGGFKDVDDYYSRSSSLKLIEKIRVPTLIVHAQDDPFVPFTAFNQISRGANPFVILLAPENGGHVGFVADSKTDGKNRFWAENRIIQFCRLLSESHNVLGR
ncbi:MAG TPA: alpha/beta fold hydrolase [Pyrinomonadaceae bacterium]